MEKLNLTPDARLQPAPENTAFDFATEVAKLGAFAFPFLGTGIALFSSVTAPLRGKRLNDWLEDVRLRMNDLSQKVDGLTPERLAQNDAFVSAFSQAAQAVMRAHKQEKLDALRNAVLNVAAGSTLSDDNQSAFLNFVDTFTATHLQLMALFNSKDRSDRIKFREPRELTDQFMRDLRERGLLRDTRAYVAQGRESPEPLVLYDWEVTNFGRQFLEFITSPLSDSI